MSDLHKSISVLQSFFSGTACVTNKFSDFPPKFMFTSTADYLRVFTKLSDLGYSTVDMEGHLLDLSNGLFSGRSGCDVVTGSTEAKKVSAYYPSSMSLTDEQKLAKVLYVHANPTTDKFAVVPRATDSVPVASEFQNPYDARFPRTLSYENVNYEYPEAAFTVRNCHRAPMLYDEKGKKFYISQNYRSATNSGGGFVPTVTSTKLDPPTPFTRLDLENCKKAEIERDGVGPRYWTTTSFDKMCTAINLAVADDPGKAANGHEVTYAQVCKALDAVAKDIGSESSSSSSSTSTPAPPSSGGDGQGGDGGDGSGTTSSTEAATDGSTLYPPGSSWEDWPEDDGAVTLGGGQAWMVVALTVAVGAATARV